MLFRYSILCCYLFLFDSPVFSDTPKKYQETFLLMGSKFEIAVISDDSKFAQKAINDAKEEIQRIEGLISSWDEGSETTRINNNAGIKPVVVSIELFNLIRRAIKVSKLTNGAFDISFAAVDSLWKFDGSMVALPSEKLIQQSIEKINYKNIVLNKVDHSVYLAVKGMKIGFGAIGKGYAANKAKQLLIKNGVTQGMINAGGDLIVWGKGINGVDWKVGIADPNKKKAYISWLSIKDMAVVTSGNYERFALIDGVRYAHIIDPRTGYPVTGVKSVTIICPDAELADALATSVFVMGVKEGVELVNKLDAVECIIVNDNDELFTSNNINKILQ